MIIHPCQFFISSSFQVGGNAYGNVWYIDIYHLLNIDLVGYSDAKSLV